MRLTKIKLAGFKSFVDPTQINFPSNLTGVVGPNGCGKSNVIDAVRWVMGELSAKHLRGDNMADVVFNGSAARKPVGTASVELVFDNADGKIGGAYAGYSEISLKRQVARDGTSAYFINAGRCRRKDITNLFLGTGLGSRSYAIIEQGMISRVIDAKAEDMRAFVEEAAGISRYKERRKETEARIADTRENLERLQDVRDEVEKQIRHLQRQAATARRYQALKEQERRLTAELLALRLRELDSGAEVHDATVRARELAMQAALSEQRAAEAAIEAQRLVHAARSEQLSAVQGRYYEVGADISRLEQSIEHTRELRERQQGDLSQTHATLTELANHIERDEAQLAVVRAELTELTPELERAQHAEAHAAAALEASERALQDWQQRWESHTQAVGAAEQTTQVERARIEQLENQLRRLSAQAQRLTEERDSLSAAQAHGELDQLTDEEERARTRSAELTAALATAHEQLQARRAAQLAAEATLETARGAREGARAELTSLEALQAAALSDHAGADRRVAARRGPRDAAAAGDGSGGRGRLGAGGRDRARGLPGSGVRGGTGRGRRQPGDADHRAADALGRGDRVGAAPGRHARRAGARARPRSSRSCRACSPPTHCRRRSRSARGCLRGGSYITPAGEWVGREWLRVSRGTDQRAGVLEREQRLKELRAAAARARDPGGVSSAEDGPRCGARRAARR